MQNSTIIPPYSEKEIQEVKPYYDSLAYSLNHSDHETGYEGWTGEDLMAMLF